MRNVYDLCVYHMCTWMMYVLSQYVDAEYNPVRDRDRRIIARIEGKGYCGTRREAAALYDKTNAMLFEMQFACPMGMSPQTGPVSQDHVGDTKAEKWKDHSSASVVAFYERCWQSWRPAALLVPCAVLS
jgi:hypothetical protein